MDFEKFKIEQIKSKLGIDGSFPEILSFIDFANVNYWFEEDRYDAGDHIIGDDEKLSVDIQKLRDFISIFSSDSRFYYGHDPQNKKSLGFLIATKNIYGKYRVFTKPLQKIKHCADGECVNISKCNFDVEICVDAIRLLDNYQTFCLLSSDADFVHLARFLKSKGKRIILIKGGYILHSLREVADLVISAQDIKGYIAVKKQKPGR